MTNTYEKVHSVNCLEICSCAEGVVGKLSDQQECEAVEVRSA